MFDNPKKELERLEQQLLAAEMDEPMEETEEVFDDLYDEINDEFSEEAFYGEDEDSYDDLYGRAAGFDADEEAYYMDEDRYAAPPKQKGFRGLVIFALAQAILIIALVTWWLGRLL